MSEWQNFIGSVLFLYFNNNFFSKIKLSSLFYFIFYLW
ncbi:hypothetical protein SALWKB29_2255 [Snodgrassella communis]|uniref:Uncharacterized protein n=1 Tax=Snodgrassella communis TaxID=2946699 RepID=A0A836MNS8_9NEIS|nr:hypothetical protein SALWKB29_2255 [Snodgrassella communis]